MEAVQHNNVKVPNAVIVSGITNTETDDEVFDFLKQYGSFERIIPVDSAHFDKQVIIEYRYGTAVQALTPILPYTLVPHITTVTALEH